MVRAVYEDRVVAIHLYYTKDDVAYSHLAAGSPEGYALNAMYAVYQKSLEHFAGKVRWLHWGAGAGLAQTGHEGLSQFKRGWSTLTRPVWFCGKVLDTGRYDALAAVNNATAGNYFPAYRSGEF
jgi:hypothetical protein